MAKRVDQVDASRSAVDQRQRESRWEHADNESRIAIDENRLAQHVGGATELPLPEAMTD
jgi:hypothetical protein